MKLTLGEIAEKLELELRGDASIVISGIAGLKDAGPGQLSFLFSSAYSDHLSNSKAEALVLREEDAQACKLPVLISATPRLSWAHIAKLFDPEPLAKGKVDETAIISPSATYGSGVSIGPYTVIEANVRLDHGVVIGPGCFVGERSIIGEGSRLAANVSVYHDVSIGENAIIHSSSVIGSDGFGFEFDRSKGSFVKIPQIYGVKIGDNVEIGAGNTIDRGALSHTCISDGVKLDSQVHIGHGAAIGLHTVISGCTAIGGSTKVGAYCLIGGAVSIIDNIEIVDQVEITGMSMVIQSIKEKGRYSSGTGILQNKIWKRSIVGFAKLNEILKRIRALERHSFKK